MHIDVKPRIRQPRTRSAIDWSHPLTRALRFAYTVDPARPYGDLVSGRNGVPTSGVSCIATPYGCGLGLAGSSDRLNFGNGGIPNAGKNISIFVRFKMKAAFGLGLLGMSADKTGGGFGWVALPTGHFLFSMISVVNINSGITATDNRWIDLIMIYTYGVSIKFAIRDLFSNIIQFNTVPTVLVPLTCSLNSVIGDTVGDEFLTGDVGLASPILLTYLWDRTLTDQELLALSFEPYAFVRPVRPARWIKHVWDTVPRLTLPARERVFEVPAAARLFGVPATDRAFEMEVRRS